MYSMLAWQLPQNAGTSAGDFTALKPASLRMGRGDVRVGRIAAVAILAAKPFLPMNVAGEILLGDEVTLLSLVPNVAVACGTRCSSFPAAGGCFGAGFVLASPATAARRQQHDRQQSRQTAFSLQAIDSVQVTGKPGVHARPTGRGRS